MPVVDDFSDGNLDEYEQDGSASIVTESLQVQNTDGSGRSEYCTSLAGLPVYPSRGDTITLTEELGVEDDVTSYFMFGIDEHGPVPAGYELSINGYHNQFNLSYRDSNGDSFAILSGSVSTTGSLAISIAWRSGTGPADRYVYESDKPVVTGSHGDHAATYVSGTPLRDTGGSSYVHESGTGIDSGAGHAFEVTVNGVTETGSLDRSNLPTEGGIGFSVATYSGTTYEGRHAEFDDVRI